MSDTPTDTLNKLLSDLPELRRHGVQRLQVAADGAVTIDFQPGSLSAPKEGAMVAKSEQQSDATTAQTPQDGAQQDADDLDVAHL